MDTPVYVKLLLPPRQSRGVSQRTSALACRRNDHIESVAQRLGRDPARMPASGGTCASLCHAGRPSVDQVSSAPAQDRKRGYCRPKECLVTVQAAPTSCDAAAKTAWLINAKMVPGTGIEPVRPLCRKAADFKSAVSTNSTIRATPRLSPHMPNFQDGDSQMGNRVSGGATRSRTGLIGFAIRCITALLSRRYSFGQCACNTRRWHRQKREAWASLSLESGAGKESRTLDLNLGKVALYQLSYSRVSSLRLYNHF